MNKCLVILGLGAVAYYLYEQSQSATAVASPSTTAAATPAVSTSAAAPQAVSVPVLTSQPIAISPSTVSVAVGSPRQVAPRTSLVVPVRQAPQVPGWRTGGNYQAGAMVADLGNYWKCRIANTGGVMNRPSLANGWWTLVGPIN